MLVIVAAALAMVFGVAFRLDPFDAEGRPLRQGTHEQLGLPPCTFMVLTGVPCPACGMTTSFALLVRGELAHSLRANALGTLLAVAGMAAIPWLLLGAVTGRLWGQVYLGRSLFVLVGVFLIGMLIRWVAVLASLWWRPS